MTKARLQPRWQSFALLLALCTLPALPAVAQAPLTPFRVGMSDAVNTVLPLWMAQAGGLFAANGLNVELVTRAAAAAARRSCKPASSTSCGLVFPPWCRPIARAATCASLLP